MEWNWKGLVKDKRQKRKWLSSLTNVTTDIKLEDLYGDIAMTNLYCKTENSDFFFCIIFSGHQDWAQCQEYSSYQINKYGGDQDIYIFKASG